MNPNPFKPTAGKRPPILIGRESVIEDFEEGLDNGAGAPGQAHAHYGKPRLRQDGSLAGAATSGQRARMGGCLRFRFAWLMRPLGRRASLE